jgi:hypothetical protein
MSNYGGRCVNDNNECSDHVRVDMEYIEGNISNLKCSLDRNCCIVSLKCVNCMLTNSANVILTMLEEQSYATEIYISVTSSSSIPEGGSSLLTKISANDDKFFRGPNPNIAHLLMTPSLFITNSEDWENELKGYHISILRDSEKGTQIDYSE